MKDLLKNNIELNLYARRFQNTHNKSTSQSHIISEPSRRFSLKSS